MHSGKRFAIDVGMRLLAVLAILLAAALWFLRSDGSTDSEPTNLTSMRHGGVNEGGGDRSVPIAPTVAETSASLRVEVEEDPETLPATASTELGTIHCTVLRQDGARCANAIVELSVIDASPRKIAGNGREDRLVARTDESGRCALEVRDQVTYAVQARGPGSRSAEVRPLFAGDHATLRLEPESDLHGSVISADDGQPLGNALLLLEADGVTMHTMTSNAGAFRFEGLRRAPAKLEILASGYESRTLRITPDFEPHAIALSTGRAVNGRVVRAGDSVPVADASVTAIARRKLGSERIAFTLGATRSDPNGNFSLPPLPAEDYEIIATTLDGRCGLEVVDPISAPITLTIATGAALHGTVRTTAAGVVAGATIALVGLSATDTPIRKTKSGADGTFGLPFLPADRDFQIVVHARECTPAILPPPTTATRNLDVVLLPANHLRGVVRDPSGNSLPGIVVELLAADESLAELLRASRSGASGGITRTDDSGGFDFAGLPPGDYRVRAADRRGMSDWIPASIAAAATVDTLITLSRALSLRGRVVGPDGATIAEARVAVKQADRAQPRMARSRDDGTFEIQPLISGPAALEVEALGFATARIELRLPFTQGTGELEIHLAEARTIRGRVVDARTRAPIPSFSLRVETLLDGDREAVSKQSVEDRRGEFVLEDLPSGELSLSVRAPGYFSKGPLAIAATMHTPLEVTLDSAGEVTGRVMGPGNVAMPGVRVFVRNLDAPAAGKITTSHTRADGSFRVRDLTPGRIVFGIGDTEKPAFALPERDLPFGETDLGTLPISGTGAVEIRLRDAEAFTARSVALRGRSTRTKLDLILGTGGARAAPLLPDTYVVELDATHRREVEVGADSEVTVEFDRR